MVAYRRLCLMQILPQTCISLRSPARGKQSAHSDILILYNSYQVALYSRQLSEWAGMATQARVLAIVYPTVDELASWRAGIETAGWVHLNSAGAAPAHAKVHNDMVAFLELERTIGGYAAVAHRKKAGGTDARAAIGELINCAADEVALVMLRLQHEPCLSNQNGAFRFGSVSQPKSPGPRLSTRWISDLAIAFSAGPASVSTPDLAAGIFSIAHHSPCPLWPGTLATLWRTCSRQSVLAPRLRFCLCSGTGWSTLPRSSAPLPKKARVDASWH